MEIDGSKILQSLKNVRPELMKKMDPRIATDCCEAAASAYNAPPAPDKGPTRY